MKSLDRARIAVLGASLQDIYLLDHDDFAGASTFSELKIGTKVDIDDLHFFVGGGGTNAATSFARFGHDTVLLSNVGVDPSSNAVEAVLDEEGIDTSYLHRLKNVGTGTSIVLLDTVSGERTILTHRGASQRFDNLDARDLDRIQPDWLYATTTRGDLKTLEKFFSRAHEVGANVMFNPGLLEIKHKHQLLLLLEHVDVLLLNKREAAALVPGTVLTELLARLKPYVDTVIITDGSMGGIAANPEQTLRFSLYEDVEVIDTTGAGDAFGSGFLAHFAAHGVLENALIYASANSTSVVNHLGAKAGILHGDSEELHPMPIQTI